MNAIKVDTTIDEAVARAIPALRPLLGKHVEFIALEAAPAPMPVRLVVEDDPAQCERAGHAFRRAVAEGGACSSRRPSWSRSPGFFESPANKIGRPSPQRFASSSVPQG